MNRLQDSIGKWGEETFNHTCADLPALHKHLEKELAELGEHIEDYDQAWGDYRTHDYIQEECADVFILLCSIAHLCGFSLREAVGCKMAINRSRTWGEPDRDGVIEHVEPAEPPLVHPYGKQNKPRPRKATTTQPTEGEETS